MNNLKQYGFDTFFIKEFETFRRSGFEPGRVTAENKQRYIIATEYGEIPGEVTGKFMFNADTSSSFPKTGDWAAISYFREENKCIIHNVLKRRSHFIRGQAGKEAGLQVIAANIDYIFIVQSFNSDYNINRIERYILMAEEGNCKPVIVMNKNDLTNDAEIYLNEIRLRLIDIPLFSVSCETGNGIDELKKFISRFKTYALVGSSGVGKSTIINILMDNELQKTYGIRISDGKGRHITTRRELFLLPEGGILIDTPGMREFSLWNNEMTTAGVFSDITELAVNCRFRDCSHTHESGCAVRTAIDNGEITRTHLENYFKLKKESDYIDSLIDKNIYFERKKKEKKLHQKIKQIKKVKKSEGNL